MLSKFCYLLSFTHFPHWMSCQLSDSSTKNSRVSWKSLMVCRCHLLTLVVVAYMCFITHSNKIALFLVGRYSVFFEIYSGCSKTLLPTVPIIVLSRDQISIPLKFCVNRWLENSNAVKAVIDLLPYLKRWDAELKMMNTCPFYLVKKASILSVLSRRHWITNCCLPNSFFLDRLLWQSSHYYGGFSHHLRFFRSSLSDWKSPSLLDDEIHSIESLGKVKALANLLAIELESKLFLSVPT